MAAARGAPLLSAGPGLPSSPGDGGAAFLLRCCSRLREEEAQRLRKGWAQPARGGSGAEQPGPQRDSARLQPLTDFLHRKRLALRGVSAPRCEAAPSQVPRV